MSRRATNSSWRKASETITPAIIQGRSAELCIPRTTVFSDNCRQLALAFPKARARPKTLPAVRLFDAVERHSSILQSLRSTRYKIVPYLIDVAARSARWVRAPDDFRPTAEHAADQVLELVRHLFERYPAPAWLQAWLEPRRGRPVCSPPFEWYLHVVQGGNLRTAPGLPLPLPLSRRAAHEAMAAPAGLSPWQALLFGHLRACGGRNEIVQEIVTLADLRDSPLDPVCVELSEKIARARDVPPEQVRPLFDYVAYRRFHCERRDRFVLADCSVSSLLKRTEEWHAALRAANYRRVAGLQCFPFAYDQRWPPCFESADFEGTCEQGAYTLTELRSAKELFEEGQHMHHCVATYTRLASTGGASIWSLRLQREGRQVGRVTIRVALPSREIVEARRFANQKIHPYELEILHRWAAKSGFTVCQGI
jgi:hypothetical protein